MLNSSVDKEEFNQVDGLEEGKDVWTPECPMNDQSP
jgi:hypothetical protein